MKYQYEIEQEAIDAALSGWSKHNLELYDIEFIESAMESSLKFPVILSATPDYFLIRLFKLEGVRRHLVKRDGRD